MRREIDMSEIVRVLPVNVSAAPSVRYSCDPAGMHRTTWRTTARATVPRCAVFGAELAEAAAPAYLPALLERHRAAPRPPRIRDMDESGWTADTRRGDPVPVIDGWALDELWAVDVATSCPH